MLSRGLYEAFYSFSGGVYSNGRPIPLWDRPTSAASERDERIWGELAEAATFAVETRQRLDAIAPGTGAEFSGVFVIRAAGDMPGPYTIRDAADRSVILARLVDVDIAAELLLQRHVAAAIGAPPAGQ